MNKNKLITHFGRMLLIRHSEDALVKSIRRGEVKTPCHLYSGQEAIAVGVCANLRRSDVVFGSHRGHGHYLAKGGNIEKLFAEIYTKELGCSKGRGGSMHLIDKSCGFFGSAPIIAQTIPLAAGAALSNKIKKNGSIAVAFFGDGAMGEGIVYETLNFAALKKLPVIFVCENNLYSSHLRVEECRPDLPIYKVAEPFTVTSIQVDGNNLLEVISRSKQAVEYVRSGNGPYFIECLTYRQRGHVGPDDKVNDCHVENRPIKEVNKWSKRDPIKLMKKYLLDNAFITKSEITFLEEKVKSQVHQAIKDAKKSEKPKVKEINKYVFK